MIRSIEIENLRGISRGAVDGLTQVNIFLGKNGSGKSTVLEAIYIASACTEAKDSLHGVDKLDYVISRRGGSGSWSDSRDVLWFSMDTSRPITVRLNVDEVQLRFKLFESRKDVLLEIETRRIVQVSRDQSLAMRFRSDEVLVSLTKHMVCSHDASSCISLSFDIKGLDEVRKAMELRKTLLLDSAILMRVRDIERSCWSKLLVKRLDKRIVEALRKEFEIDAEGLTYMPLGNQYVLMLQLSRTSVRIDDLGDGAKKLIIAGLAILAHTPSILLLEEPENHMHPAGLETYMRFVLGLAKEMGAQVFISSHSIELVKIARKVCSDLGLDMAVYFLERSKSGELDARRLSAIDSEVLEKLGLDPRFLYVL